MTQIHAITLIGAPAESGGARAGSAMGPDALRNAGLAKALAAAGHAVTDLGNHAIDAGHQPPHPNPAVHHLADYAAWTRALQRVGRQAMGAGAVPIFLGGDHSIAAGAVSGVARRAIEDQRPQFLLWLDAHPDNHTLDSTVSGHLHGTPIAYLSGQPGFLGRLPELGVPIDPANICMMGIRSVDPGQRRRASAAAIEIHDMSALHRHGVAAPLGAFLARVQAADGRLHVSLDVDFLDPEIAPAVATPVAGGASLAQARLIMAMLHDSGLVTSVDIAELNPLLDGRGRTAKIVVELVAALFGRPARAAIASSRSHRIMPTLAPKDLNVVPFVNVDNMMKLVGELGVETFLRELADTIEEDFRRWPLFDKTPRVASHSAEGVIELMPTSDGEVYGFKYVNGHPKNTRAGLQTVTAFGVLSDVETGYPLLMSEMTILTALRTAAMSALAAKYLAPKESRCMAIIGNGAQSEFQALAFKALLGVRRLRLYDIDRAATEKCVRNLAALGFDLTACGSVEEAVAGAEIITTATADKRYATILSDDSVVAGVHINAVGGDSPGKMELARDILLRSDIFVEYPPQTRVEGEIQQLSATHPVTELWRVIRGEAEGRRSHRQITLFDSVGFAIEDFSALRYLRDKLAEAPYFDNLDLVDDPDDPRDLFGMVMRSAKSGEAEMPRAEALMSR